MSWIVQPADRFPPDMEPTVTCWKHALILSWHRPGWSAAGCEMTVPELPVLAIVHSSQAQKGFSAVVRNVAPSVLYFPTFSEIDLHPGSSGVARH